MGSDSTSGSWGDQEVKVCFFVLDFGEIGAVSAPKCALARERKLWLGAPDRDAHQRIRRGRLDPSARAERAPITAGRD